MRAEPKLVLSLAWCVALRANASPLDLPFSAAMAGAGTAIARGAQALETNPAGVALGEPLDLALYWSEDRAASRNELGAGLTLRSDQLGVGALVAIPAERANPLPSDWALVVAAAPMRRPHGGYLALGGALRKREERVLGEIALAAEPVPMVSVGAVIRAALERNDPSPEITAGVAHRWADVLELVAERSFRSGAADEVRFGAQLELSEAVALRTGALPHGLSWGVGWRLGGWRADLAAVADRRRGLAWSGGVGIEVR